MIKAWPKETYSFSGEAPFRVGPTAEDGHFELELPSGQYFILAESTTLFSYYGRNTVSVPEEGLANINLPLVEKSQP